MRLCAGDIPSGCTSQIPASNIRQIAVLGQHGRIWPHVADITSEASKVAVTCGVIDAIEILGGGLEERLGVGEGSIVQGVFGNPDGLVGVSVFMD